MGRFWTQAILLSLLWMAHPPVAWAAAPLERQIDAYVAPMVAAHSFSGVVLVARGGKVLATRAYGLASQELATANRIDSKFQLASVSKPITAAAVLRLVERGKIDLHAPLSAVLPDYPNSEHMTVHQLLTHTSGVPNINQLPIYGELGLKRRAAAEIVDAFKNAKPDFQPGTKLAYSNSNYALLALIIEKVSGMPYGEFVEREIFRPLGMMDSGHRGDDAAIISRMSQGYRAEGRSGLSRPAWFDWTVKTGNGSLYSTAADLNRFVDGYFQDRLVGPELRKIATSPAQNLPQRVPGFEWMSKEVGYGWMIDSHLGRRRVYHPGNSPGFNTAIAYYPDDKLTIVVLSNIYINNAVPLSEAFAGMALGFQPPAPVLADSAIAPTEFSGLVGDYRFGSDFPDRKRITIYEMDGHLWLRPEGVGVMASPLLPAGKREYVARFGWTRITFDGQPGAKSTGLSYAEGSQAYRAERIP